MYIREHWDEMPFNATGETIQNDGVWKVHESLGRWTPSCSGIASVALRLAGFKNLWL
jgi:hypothetical protein